jgi:hypothetical protein
MCLKQLPLVALVSGCIYWNRETTIPTGIFKIENFNLECLLLISIRSKIKSIIS